MPRATVFKANSVVFFKGDVSEKIFILKSGKILLKTNDIETGEEIKELIMTGEFFGVKSALGRFPRDGTALVMQDSEVLVFNVSEFEQLVLKNTRIIMKMLRVFSNQLRRIHNQVKNLISQGKSLPPEEGLFTIGEYYFKNGLFSQALYTYQRYLTYYPSGDFATQATSRIPEAERLAKSGASRPPATTMGVSGGGMVKPQEGSSSGESGKKYYDALSLISQKNYPEALKILAAIIKSGEEKENLAKAEMEYGKTLILMGKQDDGIKQLTQLIQKYPKHPDLKEALYFIGKAYEEKGENEWAVNFYNKVLAMATEDEKVAVKTRKALRAMEGGQS